MARRCDVAPSVRFASQTSSAAWLVGERKQHPPQLARASSTAAPAAPSQRVALVAGEPPLHADTGHASTTALTVEQARCRPPSR